ncbi:MAG: peptide deformylase [Chloroflexota bacterium]|nr:peptide deformylase [Chloroflexota bacterium]
MTIREITIFPEEVLRQDAKPVEVFDDDLAKLVDDMVDTMREAPGVGLAAPQIGISKRIIVVEFGDEADESIPKQLYVMINPEIIKESNDKVPGVEGCLSVPGVVGRVNRSRVVTLRGQNIHGKPVKIRTQGWLARIFQHEIDHINGVLYTDRAEDIWKPEHEDLDTI